MPIDNRLDFKKAITELIEGTPGYNLQGKVYRGRRRFSEETDTPCVSIFELPPENESSRAGTSAFSQECIIAVQGMIEDKSSNHPTDVADEFRLAVRKQLGKGLAEEDHPMRPKTSTNVSLIDGVATNVIFDSGIVFEPDETTPFAYFIIKLSATISETLRD